MKRAFNNAAIFSEQYEIDELETDIGVIGPVTVHYEIRDVTSSNFGFHIFAFDLGEAKLTASTFIDMVGLTAWKLIEDAVADNSRLNLMENAA